MYSQKYSHTPWLIPKCWHLSVFRYVYIVYSFKLCTIFFKIYPLLKLTARPWKYAGPQKRNSSSKKKNQVLLLLVSGRVRSFSRSFNPHIPSTRTPSVQWYSIGSTQADHWKNNPLQGGPLLVINGVITLLMDPNEVTLMNLVYIPWKSTTIFKKNWLLLDDDKAIWK